MRDELMKIAERVLSLGVLPGLSPERERLGAELLALADRSGGAADGDVREALRIAADLAEIADDWNLTNVQVYPPVHWKLEAQTHGDDIGDGWVATSQLEAKFRELIAAPSPDAQHCAQGVPEGWHLVPSQINSAMLFAWESTKVFDDGLPHERYQACYRAMLDAAPSPFPTEVSLAARSAQGVG